MSRAGSAGVYRRVAGPSGTAGGISSAFSARRRHQSRDSEQIVGGGDQVGVHLHALTPAVAGLAQASYGFHPAEGFLDTFTDPLADSVTWMTGSAGIEGGTAGPRIILGHMRGDSKRAATGDEVAGVIALIAAQCDAAAAGQPFIRHGDRRPSLGSAIGRLDLQVN